MRAATTRDSAPSDLSSGAGPYFPADVPVNRALVEEGSHQELMDRDGLYAHMFRLQAGPYLDK